MGIEAQSKQISQYSLSLIYELIVYFYIGSLFFENASGFWNDNFFLSKISIILLTFFGIISVKNYSKYLLKIFIPITLLIIVSYLEFLKITKFQITLFYNLTCSYYLLIFIRGKSTHSKRVIQVYLLLIFCLFLFYLFNVNSTYEIAGDLDLLRLRLLNLNQNQLGVFLSLAFILSLNYLSGVQRLLCIIIVLIMLQEVASRLCLLSILLSFVIYIYYKFKGIKFFIFSICLIVFIILASFFLPENILVIRMKEFVVNGGLSSRDLIIFTIFEEIDFNYWFGIGYNGYLNATNDLIGIGELSPHNVFIEVFLYSGILGFILFLYFLFLLFRLRGLVCKRSKIVFLSCFVLFLGILLSAQFFENRLSWFVLVIMLSSQYFFPFEKKSINIY